jgi:hypothetical protein
LHPFRTCFYHCFNDFDNLHEKSVW